jgi:hypothetical protein
VNQFATRIFPSLRPVEHHHGNIFIQTEAVNRVPELTRNWRVSYTDLRSLYVTTSFYSTVFLLKQADPEVSDSLTSQID